MNPAQQQISVQMAIQITDQILRQMKTWLESQKNLGEGLNGYQFDSHPSKTAEAIKSVHHSRLLLPLYLRDLVLQQQAQNK